MENIQFKNTIAFLNDFGKELVENYKDRLILGDINASDNLYDSVRCRVDAGTAGRLDVKLTLAHYWRYIEEGRVKGIWPPIDAIEKWIEVKPIIPRPNDNGELPTNRDLAFRFANKIFREGIPAKPILEKSIEEIWGVFEEFLQDALSKDISSELDIMYREVGL